MSLGSSCSQPGQHPCSDHLPATSPETFLNPVFRNCPCCPDPEEGASYWVLSPQFSCLFVSPFPFLPSLWLAKLCSFPRFCPSDFFLCRLNLALKTPHLSSTCLGPGPAPQHNHAKNDLTVCAETDHLTFMPVHT